MARLLVIVTILAHALLVAQGCSSRELEGSGSGSGSGEPECRVPNPRPDLPGTRSQSDAIREARCHLTCIEKVR